MGTGSKAIGRSDLRLRARTLMQPNQCCHAELVENKRQ